MWQEQNRWVLFMMLGSVQNCRLVEATTIGHHLYKAFTIIPLVMRGENFRSSPENYMGRVRCMVC